MNVIFQIFGNFLEFRIFFQIFGNFFRFSEIFQIFRIFSDFQRWGIKHDTRRQNSTAWRQSFGCRLSDTCRFVFQIVSDCLVGCFRLFQIIIISNFRFSTKFQIFDQISDFRPNFRFSTKFQNVNQISEFQPNFRISTKFQTNFRILTKV